MLTASGARRPITEPGGPTGTWSDAAIGACSWPTWSNDRRRIACFSVTRADGLDSTVVVHDADGVYASEVASLDKRLPIYLSWAPDDQHLAVLTQADGRLHLSACRTDQIGPSAELAYGSPLFLSWVRPRQHGERNALLAFTGSAVQPSRMLLLDPADASSVVVLPGVPRNFCAPLSLGRHLWYVVEDGERSAIVKVDRVGGEVTTVESIDGLVSLVASPSGRYIAVARATNGDGSPYRGLHVLDAETGARSDVLGPPCLAFLWAPAEDALIVAVVDTARNRLNWARVPTDGGAPDRLASIQPTRELVFYLRFFEQYAWSHPIVHPDGTHLVVGGGAPNVQAAGDVPLLYRLPLDGDPLDEIGPGVFGVFPPYGPR